MTVETTLRAAMAEAVAPAHADTDRLVSTARRRGLGIRRRRQALGAVGVAAALTLAVSVPTLLAGSGGARPMATATTDVSRSSQAFDPTPVDPLTGRAAAAALLYAVRQEAQGAVSDVRGAVDSGPQAGAYVVFRFTPQGSRSSGEVAINVDPNYVPDLKAGEKAPAYVRLCQSYMKQCTATSRPDGSTLLTYDDRSSYGSGGVRRVAWLYRPDNVRLVVSASNGYDVTERGETVTGTEPVLTTEQLVAVVTQPWWGPRLPAYFTLQGAELQDFSDRSSSAISAPSSKD